MDAYLGISETKNATNRQICKLCRPCRDDFLAQSAKFISFMRAYLLYKCFKFGTIPIINEGFICKNCDGANSSVLLYLVLVHWYWCDQQIGLVAFHVFSPHFVFEVHWCSNCSFLPECDYIIYVLVLAIANPSVCSL